MKRYRSLLVAGGVAYLLILLASFPAQQAAGLLHKRLGAVYLQGVSGTVFSGQAARVDIQGQNLGPLNWSLKPLALLLARLEFHVELSDPALRGDGRLGLGLAGGVHVRDATAELLPDPWVNQFLPIKVETTGSVSLELGSVELDGGFPQALSGDIVWDNASVLSPVELSLGRVEVALSNKENALLGKVSNSGETRLSGDFSLAPGGDYAVHLILTPGAATSAEFVDMLESVAPRQPGGAYRLVDSGRL